MQHNTTQEPSDPKGGWTRQPRQLQQQQQQQQRQRETEQLRPTDPTGTHARDKGAYQSCTTSGRQPQLSEGKTTEASTTHSQHQGLKRPLPPKSGHDEALKSPQSKRSNTEVHDDPPETRASRLGENVFQTKHSPNKSSQSGESDPKASACNNDDSNGGHPALSSAARPGCSLLCNLFPRTSHADASVCELEARTDNSVRAPRP